MATIDSEPRPGTAFEKIMEEQAILDEFMSMVKEKLEIDKRHLDRLIKLQNTWNPKWSVSGVQTLISPILAYFNQEIEHLKVAEDRIIASFSAIPEQTIRQERVPSEFDHLKADYKRCEQRYRVTATKNSQDEFSSARVAMERLVKDNGLTGGYYQLIPDNDHHYRVAVHIQRQRLSPVLEWYNSKLEEIVERHQQRAEDLKAFFLGFCGNQGKLITDLSASCSTALRSTRAFASSQFIAPRHEEIAQERSHPLLQKFEYRNFFDGRIVRPLFGVSRMQTIMLANLILDAMERPEYLSTRRYSEGKIDWVFNIEESALTNPDLEAATRQYTPNHLRILLKVALWSERDPLFESSDWNLSQYANGVPRKKLPQFVQSLDEELQESVMKLLPRLWRTFASTSSDTVRERMLAVARLLCRHEAEAKAPIIRDIWRKWDFDGNRPLPDGVTREVVSPWRLIWTKSGAPYVTNNSTAIGS